MHAARPHLPFHVADDIPFHARLDLDSFQSFFDLGLEIGREVGRVDEAETLAHSGSHGRGQATILNFPPNSPASTTIDIQAK